MTGRLQSLVAMHERIYVDANIVVYYIEDCGHLSDIAAECVDCCAARGIRMVTSELSLAECLWGVYKSKREKLADLYRNWFFDEALIELCPIETQVLELAASTGPRHNLRLADAVHVASALAAECSAMLTNDKRLRIPDALQVIQIADFH